MKSVLLLYSGLFAALALAAFKALAQFAGSSGGQY